MSIQREIITIALGNYSNLVATQYFNGNTRFDTEQNVLYFGGRSTKTRYPRVVMLDHQHPSKICKELDFNAVELNKAEDQLGIGSAAQHCDSMINGRTGSDIYSVFSADQLEGEDDTTYAERMFVQDEDTDDGGTLYGVHDIAMRIKKSRIEDRKQKREEHRIQQEGVEMMDVKESINEENDDENDDENDLVPIFQVNDPLVPWYRYITSSLHKRSYSLMSSSHADPRGVSLLHSFGHGIKLDVTGGCSRDEHLIGTYDNIRYHLEQTDSNQGLQFICDADGALGGIAWGIIRNLRDECDDKITTICHATFDPFDIGVDFATQRSEEVILNRALATHYLSDICSLYIPYHIHDWESDWGCPYVKDNAATAQMIAATIDTAFYNSRDGENFSNRNGSDLVDVNRNKNEDEDDDHNNKVSIGLSNCSLEQYAFCLRPNKSDKISGAFTALPMQMKTRKVPVKLHPILPTFDQFLNDHILLQLTSNFLSSNGTAGLPTLGVKMTYVPLSYGIRHLPGTAQGAVHAQVVSLRGIGELEDKQCSRSDAVSVYINDTRCHRSIVTVTNKGYPVSGTFAPVVIGMSNNTKDLSTTFTNTVMGAHIANTNNCGELMRKIVSDVKPIIRYKKSNYVDSYGLEDDEWADMLEGLEAMRDNYDHGNEDNENDSDDI